MDEMDEILELQRQLAAAQQGTASQKLSDRNCVELVMKLQALNLIQLIFTRSGKEYLTHKQLTIEVEDEILARGGRVNVIDLPDAINVELSHIQTKLPAIISASEGTIQLIRGEILTDYYLTSLAEEVNDTLNTSENGVDHIGSIASRYTLPVDVIRDAITRHTGTLIDATLDPATGVLRSAASITRDRAAARGLLRALSAPTVLTELAESHDLQPALVLAVANDLLSSGALAGAVSGRGTRAVLTPRVFADAAVRAAVSAFAANGFLRLDRLARMHVDDPTAFVDEHLAGGIVLAECVAGPVLIDTLATSASEASTSGGWLDVEVALPLDFPPADVTAVVARLSQFLTDGEASGADAKLEVVKSTRSRRKGRNSSAETAAKTHSKEKVPLVFGQRFIVSTLLTERFSAKVVSDAVSKAAERAKLMAERMAMVVSHTEAVVKEENGATTQADGGKKSKGKGRRRAGAKDKSSGRSASGEGKTSGDQTEFSVAVPSVDEVLEIILADEELSNAIETDYLGSSVAGDEMLAAVLEDVYGEDGLSTLYRNLAAEAIVDLERQRATAKKNAEKALLVLLESAELYNKSAECLPSDELQEASRTHVVDSTCVGALSKIVNFVAQNTGVIHPGLVQIDVQESKREKLDILRDATSKLAPALSSTMRSLIATVSDRDGATVDDFLAQYDESIALLDLPERRPLDKKGEKAAFASARASLTMALDDQEHLSEVKALEIGATLLHAKNCGGAIVMLPSESVFPFSKEVETTAKPVEAGTALREIREALSAEAEASANSSVTLTEDFLEKLRALREYTG